MNHYNCSAHGHHNVIYLCTDFLSDSAHTVRKKDGEHNSHSHLMEIPSSMYWTPIVIAHTGEMLTMCSLGAYRKKTVWESVYHTLVHKLYISER